MAERVRLEDHHPDMMKYREETRRIINAYNGHGIVAGHNRAGWEAVDIEMGGIIDSLLTDAFQRGMVAERSSSK